MSNLPKYVKRGRSAFEYCPYRGPHEPRRTIRLCPLDAPMSEVWRMWEALQDNPPDTLAWLLNEYINSREFRFRGKRPKASTTIKEQERQAEVIRHHKLKSGREFGSFGLKAVTPGMVQKYLDARRRQCIGEPGEGVDQ